MKNNDRIEVRMPKTMKEKVKYIADDDFMTASEYVRMLIERDFDKRGVRYEQI